MSASLRPRPIARPLWAAAGAVMLALGGAIILWVHYGAIVFFEMMRAGFVACFG